MVKTLFLNCIIYFQESLFVIWSLESGGSGGVVWRIKTADIKLVCAVGSRNGTEETKLMVLDFDAEK